ncbi:hypothetical protein FRC03_000972 [Tulasnella sp. 419]|nr:hypothetical protein FRC03_000972 [Tulasnella sp. 419]
MSRRSPYQTSAWQLSRSPSISPDPNLEISQPENVQARESNGLPSTRDRTQTLLVVPGTRPTIGDVENQMHVADPAPINSEAGTTGPIARPLQGSHDAFGQRNRSSTPTENLQNAPSNLDQYSDFWNVYNQEADREDSQLINSFSGDLDTLLIFAGLFSATNTAFIIESYKDLKQDSSSLTNDLLRNMMRKMHQSSFNEADLLLDSYAGPSPQAIVVNLFFFSSLCCSLFAAFGAVIGKQWLNHYERESQLRSPSIRGIERQMKYMGLTKWRFQAVVETLPTLLQFSLFFFFIGLINFLWPLSYVVAILIIVFSVVTLLFYIITLIIGILYQNSPFQTRLTEIMRNRLIRKKPAPDMNDNGKMDVLRARCVDWLNERTSFSGTRGIVARAVALLPDNAKQAINLNHGGATLAYILRSSLSNGRVYLGISAEGLQSCLTGLQDLISQWNKEMDVVHQDDAGNTYFLQVLSRELWNLLLRPGTMDEIETSAALDVLEKLGPIEQVVSPATCARYAKYLVELLARSSSRRDQLLRLTFLHDATWSKDCVAVGPYITARHMPEVLASTMWGAGGEPDLDHQRVSLRLSWFLNDIDGMYPSIQDHAFGRYLSLWRESHVQHGHSSSHIPDFHTNLYLKTVIGLLFHDQEKWAVELDNCGHLEHIGAVNQGSSDIQLLYWIAFILLSSSARPRYYSEAWADMVLRRADTAAPPWDWIPRKLYNVYKPAHVDLLLQSLEKYLQNASQSGCISTGRFNEVFKFDDLKDWRRKLPSMDKPVGSIVIGQDGMAEIPDFMKEQAEMRDGLTALRDAIKEQSAAKSSLTFNLPSTIMPSEPKIFGRQAYIEDAIKLLLSGATARLVILGPGGMGKTSVALKIVHDPRVMERYGQYRCWVPCDQATSILIFVELLAKSLNLPPSSSADRFSEVIVFLENSQTVYLILLDNFETPWDIEGQQSYVVYILTRLASIPTVSLLITMRGGQYPASDTIGWSTPRLPSLTQLDPDPAEEAFLRISPEAAGDPELGILLRELDNMPLAITLMAKLSEAGETISDLLAQWKTERTRLLEQSGGGSYNSIESSIKLSLESRAVKGNPDALRLLSVLARLPAGANLARLPHICPSIPNWRAALRVLRGAALVYDGADKSGVRVLSPIQSYILLHHPLSQEALEELRSAYYQLALQVKEEIQHPRPESDKILEELAMEDVNMETVLLDALYGRGGNREEAIKASISYSVYLHWKHPDTKVIIQAGQVAREIGSSQLAECLLWHANILRALGNDDLAEHVLQNAKEEFNKMGKEMPAVAIQQRSGGISQV